MLNCDMMMTKRLFHFLLLLMIATLPATAVVKGDTCPVVRIVPERLPDMTVARSGHCVFYASGELTVVGGHTSGFVPVPTAEYYADGKWNQLPMAYSHDNGFAVVLRSGQVLIGGGHSEELGVGQTFTLERYIPALHTFEGFGCLDRRRVLANATELRDGRVIIAGNHYAADAIGCYDGRSQVQHVKNVAQGRCNPYVLPLGDDDALILSGNDIHDNHPATVWVDRVKGDAFRVPLLEQWRPVYTDQPFSSMSCAIVDPVSKAKPAYLLTTVDSCGQMGIVIVCDTTFSLLPTACPIPMQGPWGTIAYKGPVIVDRERQRGYVLGVDSLYHRQYILAVDYAQIPAALTLYHTDSIERATITIPVMTPDGDLILTGGIPNDNYKPLTTVWCYHFGTQQPESGAAQPVWPWVFLACLLIMAFVGLVLYHRHRSSRVVRDILPDSSPGDQIKDASVSYSQLMERVCELVERDQQYLTSRLRLSDIAVELGVSVTTLTDCINIQRHCTFAQLIAEYRVHHAQQLLAEHPDMKLSALIAESGFSSESTFFRCFKSVTGLSPKEWLAQRSF